MAKLSGKMKARQRQSQRQHAARTVAKPAKSTPQAQGLWRWPDQRADKIDLLNSVDKWSDTRNQLRTLAGKVGEFAGFPMAIEGENLVIEPSYDFAHIFNKKREEADKEGIPDDIKVRNQFWSSRLRCTIIIWEEGGKICGGKVPGLNHLNFDMHTMGCAVVWGVEQESRALQLLAGMLSHHKFKTYLLTGMFLESSPRSGLTYLFRKLKPTVVIDARGHASDKSARILCTLCMHPIGYYDGTWAGAMCPTDDVIAHLALMRGDEHMLWRRANQHAPDRPESGI